MVETLLSNNEVLALVQWEKKIWKSNFLAGKLRWNYSTIRKGLLESFKLLGGVKTKGSCERSHRVAGDTARQVSFSSSTSHFRLFLSVPCQKGYIFLLLQMSFDDDGERSAPSQQKTRCVALWITLFEHGLLLLNGQNHLLSYESPAAKHHHFLDGSVSLSRGFITVEHGPHRLNQSMDQSNDWSNYISQRIPVWHRLGCYKCCIEKLGKNEGIKRPQHIDEVS